MLYKIIGPRQSGKTTKMANFLRKLKNEQKILLTGETLEQANHLIRSNTDLYDSNIKVTTSQLIGCNKFDVLAIEETDVSKANEYIQKYKNVLTKNCMIVITGDC